MLSQTSRLPFPKRNRIPAFHAISKTPVPPASAGAPNNTHPRTTRAKKFTINWLSDDMNTWEMAATNFDRIFAVPPFSNHSFIFCSDFSAPTHTSFSILVLEILSPSPCPRTTGHSLQHAPPSTQHWCISPPSLIHVGVSICFFNKSTIRIHLAIDTLLRE